MKISVVIPTHRRPDALRRCLESLVRQDISPQDFEVVVVADGPETRLVMEVPFALRWVELDRNRGQAAARNAGAGAARCEWLLFLDDDLVATPGLVRSHLERAAAGRVVFGKTLDPGQTKYYSRLDRGGTPRWPEDAWLGPNCSIERSIFAAAGGFDAAEFPRYGEDIDLGFRLWERGLEFIYAPEAVATHEDGKGWLAKLRAQHQHGATAFALCRRYPKYRRELPLALIAVRRKRWGLRLGAMLPFWGGSAKVAWSAGCKNEASRWEALGQVFGARLPVLLYHHIGEPSGDEGLRSLTISREQFRQQISWLKKRGYSPITPSEWLGWVDEGRALPDKPVMLTFDDGLADLREPLLEAGVRAAVFAITGLARTDGLWEGRPVMSAAGLAELAAVGVEIGGHTREHPDLRMVPRNVLEDEVSGCLKDLREFGLEAGSFAYPYGEYDPEVCAAVAEVFPLAFTCDEGLNGLYTELHKLRRTMVLPNDTMLGFRLRVWLGWSPLNRVATWLRPRSRIRGLLRRVGGLR